MTGQIYELIPKVALEIGAVGKDRKNQAQGYSFRGIDDLMAAAHGPMLRAGIFCATEVFDVEQVERQSSRGGALFTTTLKMKVTFYAPDGSSVCTTTSGEGMDSADKSSNKAMSAALKYALVQTFFIPTELDDGDFETPEVQPQSAKRPAADSYPKTPDQDRVRREFGEWISAYVKSGDISDARVRELVKQANGDYGLAGRLCHAELQPKPDPKG